MNLESLSAEECLRMANALEERGELKQASQMVQIAISKAPRDQEFRKAHKRLMAKIQGGALEDEGAPDIDAMQGELDQALAVGDMTKAKAACRRLMPHQPENAALRALMGGVVTRLEGPEKGIAWARKSLKIDPDCLEGLLLQADLQGRLGRQAAASESLAKAQEIALGDDQTLSAARRAVLLTGVRAEKPKAAKKEESSDRSKTLILISLVLMAASIAIFVLDPFGVPKPTPIDVAAFQSVIPISSGEVLPDKTSAILVVPKDVWQRLDRDEQQESLEELLDVAKEQGYQRVVIRSPTNGRLGYADDNRQVLGAPGGRGR